MEKRVLNYIINQWKSEFAGTSALAISDEFDVPHSEILDLLQKLEKDCFLTTRKTQLGQGSVFKEIKSTADVTVKIPVQWEMVDTLIAFPKKKLLSEVFLQEGKDFGVFTNRLHQGDSQITHYFFSYDVLDKYLRYEDRFEVYHDSLGGSVSTKTDYFLTLPEETRDTSTFGMIRFGKFKAKNGEWCIGAIAKDLHLPISEQHHWASCEIKNAQFDEEDPSWNYYLKQNFMGDWEVPREELLTKLTDSIESLNKKIGHALFKKTKNPQVFIPVTNTASSYSDSHKELFKLISPDNINEQILKELLLRFAISKEEFTNKTSDREKGKWNLLKMLFEKVGLDFNTLEKIKKYRIENAHKIIMTKLPEKYYPEVFTNDLRELIQAISDLTARID